MIAPRRLLVSRTDHIGDVVLTTPLFEAIRKRWPAVTVDVLVRPATRELVEGNPFVSGVMEMTHDRGALIQRLREGQYDTALLVYPRGEIAWACWRAGIPHRVGSAYRWYGWMMDPPVWMHRRQDSRHELLLNFELAAPLGVSYANEPLRVPLTPADDAAAGQLLKPLRQDGLVVAVHPGSRGSAGNWSPDQYGQLMNRLMQEGMQVVVTAGSGDREAVTQALGAAGSMKPLVLMGETTLRQLTAVLKRCRVLVSGSTGPMHLAAAVGTPTVSLFPHARWMSPSRWGPWGNRAEILQPALEGETVSSISVERAFEAIQTVLGEKK